MALQTVASALRECFRKTDLVARLGGDEFAVAAVEAAPSSGGIIRARIERIVQQWNAREGVKFQLALSVGLLVWDGLDSMEDFETLLSRADALMYENKSARKSSTLELAKGASGAAGGSGRP
jgi:diguanylate cyclase (GGDEF)-like protein